MPLFPPRNNENKPEVEPLVNNWLSLSGVLNKKEARLQEELFRERPQHGQMLQSEAIYRQLALLNYRTQISEARKTPGRYQTYTVQLSLLNAPQTTDSGAMDQIMPSNPRRKRMTLLATGMTALISPRQLNTIYETTNVGSLVVLEYSFIPINVRVPIESTGPLYAIGNDTATHCVLTIIEELFAGRQILDKRGSAIDSEERMRLNQSGFEEWPPEKEEI